MHYFLSGVDENSLLSENTVFYLQFSYPTHGIICAEFLFDVGLHYLFEKQCVFKISLGLYDHLVINVITPSCSEDKTFSSCAF